MLEHCKCLIINAKCPQISSALSYSCASLPVLPAQKQCLPSPLLSSFWMSQQCHHIAQETKLVISFHLPPEVASHVSLRGTFPKALLPVPSGRTPL